MTFDRIAARKGQVDLEAAKWTRSGTFKGKFKGPAHGAPLQTVPPSAGGLHGPPPPQFNVPSLQAYTYFIQFALVNGGIPTQHGH